jgi:hypothetical protein
MIRLWGICPRDHTLALKVCSIYRLEMSLNIKWPQEMQSVNWKINRLNLMDSKDPHGFPVETTQMSIG